MLKKRRPPVDRERAEAIGLAALTFLAADEQRFAAFLAESGLDLATLKARAAEPDLLAAILDHLERDESALLVFGAERDVKVEEVALAKRLLEG
ncbi:MAG TPA: DUF3572 family protein [Hyphomicrobiaceae bacterium]|nr:DUF3572 family protein [Hyphomicrobiaceae bacterium]